MGTGYLKIEVTAGASILPVNQASVEIRDRMGNSLYNMVTDESGRTEYAELEAPGIEHDLNPYDPGPHYEVYDVIVDADGYQTYVIHGVQIFDQVSSVLPVHLLPIIGRSTQQETIQEITIPENALELTVENMQQSPTISPKVLREVVIPSTITVHLGTPSAAASNVKVPFTDYLKNVASSEIYPNWPQAALRANIYAQITFALNRIYTEWYPSRGYQYNITNSTAYDQAYVHGRNIYDSVSVIVDEIFNQYVRRQGYREPFFTQFCNGTTVTCNGLSQWGTVDLANRGYTPINILKNYYPNDIEVVSSQNIADVNASYPGTPLKEGAQGDAVKQMQDYLNRIRANYPLIPQINNPNGVFGSDTTAAVKTFQSIFDLPADGVIGNGTWYRISYIYVAVKNLAELDSEGERIGIGATPPTTVISSGSRGRYVVELQHILNVIASYYGTVPSVIENGTFDTQTRNAVVAFQQTFQLKADGIVGPSTWNQLYSVYNSITGGQTTAPPSTNYPGYILSVGSSGSYVSLMQEYLNTIGTAYPSIPKLTVDGAYGNNTRNAVATFQNIFGLTPDGIIGPVTWDKIVSVRNAVVSGNGGNTGGGNTGNPAYPGSILKVGSRGDSVRVMQTYLNALSQSYGAIPGLTPDGVYGNATANAVAAFQRTFGLTPDGIIGPITWNRIVEEYNNLDGTGSGNPSETYPGALLKNGSRGDAVLLMQNYLNALSRAYPSIPSLTPDGIYGNATTNAVVAFQRQFGLTADGIIGPTTWNRIIEEYNKLGGNGSNNQTTPYPGALLKTGSRGDSVRLMQNYLNTIGNTYTAIGNLTADGIYGNATAGAVTAFQQQFGLTADGVIGPATWNEIVNQYNQLGGNRSMFRNMNTALIGGIVMHMMFNRRTGSMPPNGNPEE